MPGRAWRTDKPPRFCSHACRRKGVIKYPNKYVITPEIHEMIKESYCKDTGNGQIEALSRKTGIPRWKITRHAIKNCWIPKTKKQPNWSPGEIKVLENNAHHSMDTIQRKLKEKGFNRTVTSIQLKRKKLKLAKNLNGHTAQSVADCFGIDIHSVIRWIQQGLLKAKRRELNRTEKQGGNPWYIKDKWIKNFIINCIDEIDFRKVDKYWLVDILVGNVHNGMGPCSLAVNENHATVMNKKENEIEYLV